MRKKEKFDSVSSPAATIWAAWRRGVEGNRADFSLVVLIRFEQSVRFGLLQ
jgi:hypothetical protein